MFGMKFRFDGHLIAVVHMGYWSNLADNPHDVPSRSSLHP